jgi:hypothetical protein
MRKVRTCSVDSRRAKLTGQVKGKQTNLGNLGPTHLAYNSSFSACFFNRNSIFLSQKNQPTVFFSQLIIPAERPPCPHLTWHKQRNPCQARWLGRCLVPDTPLPRLALPRRREQQGARSAGRTKSALSCTIFNTIYKGNQILVHASHPGLASPNSIGQICSKSSSLPICLT